MWSGVYMLRTVSGWPVCCLRNDNTELVKLHAPFLSLAKDRHAKDRFRDNVLENPFSKYNSTDLDPERLTFFPVSFQTEWKLSRSSLRVPQHAGKSLMRVLK